MIQRIRILLLVCIAAVMTACGDGGSSTDAIDKYVGNWTTCLLSSGSYGKTVLGVSKTGANSGTMSVTVQNLYSDSACTVVKTTASVTIPSTFDIVGTKSIGGNVVDKVNVTINGSAGKDVLFTTGNSLFIGGVSTKDAEGYPTVLSQPFIKS